MAGRAKMEARLREIGPPRGDSEGSTMIEKWDNALKKFSNIIEEDYKENREPRKEFEKKLEILQEIENYLAENVLNEPINRVSYELKAVVPFGSSASGLGMKGGDLDMIVCVHPPLGRKRKDLTHTRCNDILTVIFQHITQGKMMANRNWKEIEHISGARVPIVTGYVDDVEIDISISMTFLVSAQYLSSKYIDAYQKYDRRFVLLAAIAKKWHKSFKTDQNEEYYRTVFPNSCSTVLLVVFFMKHYGMLPDINKLHKDKLGESVITWEMVNQGENGAMGIPNKDVKAWKEKNSFEVGLGTLFLLFLDFYSRVVNFQSEKLNIRKGTVELKGRSNPSSRIFIVDVIDKDNPAKSVSNIPAFTTILREAVTTIKTTETVKQLKEILMSETLVPPPLTKGQRRRLRKGLRIYF